jgi:hypothetical protein
MVQVRGQVVNVVRGVHAHSLYKIVAMFRLRCKHGPGSCSGPNLDLQTETEILEAEADKTRRSRESACRQISCPLEL